MSILETPDLHITVTPLTPLLSPPTPLWVYLRLSSGVTSLPGGSEYLFTKNPGIPPFTSDFIVHTHLLIGEFDDNDDPHSLRGKEFPLWISGANTKKEHDVYPKLCINKKPPV